MVDMRDDAEVTDAGEVGHWLCVGEVLAGALAVGSSEAKANWGHGGCELTSKRRICGPAGERPSRADRQDQRDVGFTPRNGLSYLDSK
jgi:hypothetical protein